MNGEPASFTVVVCRGCCCGTTKKHPDVDHVEQEERLAAAAARVGGRLVVTDCLDECARSNVIVLRRRTPSGAESIWLGGVLGERQTGELCAYLCDGWRQRDPLPPRLAALAFRPGRDVKRRQRT